MMCVKTRPLGEGGFSISFNIQIYRQITPLLLEEKGPGDEVV